MKYILASSSPRRQQLLRLIGIEPVIIKPTVDETVAEGESPRDFLERVSIAKTRSVQHQDRDADVIIGADTIVLLDGAIIGKPADSRHAFQILSQLSGKRHEVWTGLALLHRGDMLYERSCTDVHFDVLHEDEIRVYLDNEVYMDKAGAYAIQGRAAVFVRRIEGCYFNVMGFPLHLFKTMMGRLGISLMD